MLERPKAAQEFKRRFDLWEPHIHSFVAVDDESFNRDYPKAEPLTRVTVGVKDIIDVAGLPTRNGSETCADVRPATKDAPVVKALRDAGAIIAGKTATTEFAFTDPTACRNPHDTSRSPGGSSSGSGAAVAAGVVDLALGTQTAGSLCRPAAYCGVVGFKPTFGTLSTQGVTPLAPSFDTLGIIAKSVRVASQAYDVLAPDQHAPATRMSDQRLHCGLWNTEVALQAEMRNALEAAKSIFKTGGARVDEIAFDEDLDRIVSAHRTVMNYEAAVAHGDLLSGHSVGVLKPKFKAALRAGVAISESEATKAMAYLRGQKHAFWDSHADTDLILTLAVPEGAPLIDGTTGFQDWLTPWTVFGGPLLCLPWGLDRLNRPCSVMLAGKPGEDAKLLMLAAELETHAPPRPVPIPPKGD